MTRYLMVAAVLLAGGPAWAQSPQEGLTFRFVVDGPLRPPAHELEWVNGSPDDVLCFEGVALAPDTARLSYGHATGCARIVAQHPLEGGGAVLALQVRHVIALSRGVIVDDDFAIVVPLLDSPTRTYTHGLTATTDEPNILPELGTRAYRNRSGTVGVNGALDLSTFPGWIRFDAIFTIRLAP
jgi:hypothetical protein